MTDLPEHLAQQFYAGVVGITPNGNVYAGYDDSMDLSDWTQMDKLTLATAMLRRWSDFQQKLLAEIRRGAMEEAKRLNP